MPNDNAIKFGILKCRDLVELYYGARMVVSVFESEPAASAVNAFLVFGADPRRIRYEIVVANRDPAAQEFFLGTGSAQGPSTLMDYSILPGDSLVIERNFIEDMEAVCMEQWGLLGNVNMSIATRETFLTPIPVDEMP